MFVTTLQHIPFFVSGAFQLEHRMFSVLIIGLFNNPFASRGNKDILGKVCGD